MSQLPRLSPIVLQGAHVKLVPMETSHAPALWAAGADPQLWALQPRSISSLSDMRNYVNTAVEDFANGTGLPWVTVCTDNDEIVGSTRFIDVALAHGRIEIGATWISPAMQRSGINVEAKYLQLAYAFEDLKLERVVFKTELLNIASQTAIKKLGAIQEGIFYHHLRTDAGRWRDMVYFAVLREQWPDVKTQLLARLSRHSIQKSNP